MGRFIEIGSKRLPGTGVGRVGVRRDGESLFDGYMVSAWAVKKF